MTWWMAVEGVMAIASLLFINAQINTYFNFKVRMASLASEERKHEINVKAELERAGVSQAMVEAENAKIRSLRGWR